VREFVHEHPHPPVRRLAGVDDDELVLGVAPTARRPAQGSLLDAVAESRGERGQRVEQVGVAIAGDRPGRRLERDGLPPG